MPPPIGPASPGDVIAGRYRLESWLGQGNMAAVFRATHLGTGHMCALKLVHAHLVERPEIRDMFIQEAKIGARIGKNPHIVDVFDAGLDTERGVPFLAMDLLEGQTLDRFVKQHGPIPSELLRTLFLQLGDALGQAHAKGVVHRDLKPGNLFLTYDRKGAPTLKVVDFGIAKLIEEGAQKTATQVGSPAYAAPEQVGQAIRPMAAGMGVTISPNVSPQTDIWALGVIAYELLLGAPPGHLWTGAEHGTVPDIIMGVVINPTPSAVSRAGANAAYLPYGFDQWLDRCLRKDAAERWPSVEEAVGRLTELLSAGFEDAKTLQMQPHAMLLSAAARSPGAAAPAHHELPAAAPAPVETVLLPPEFHNVPPAGTAAPPLTEPFVKTAPLTRPPDAGLHTGGQTEPAPAALHVQRSSSHAAIPPAAATTQGLAGTQPPAPKGASSRRFALALIAAVLVALAGVSVFMLAPRRGQLRITVTGGGDRVAIFVDGRERCGTTPCLVTDLEPGEREIKVSADGRPEVITRAIIERGTESELEVPLDEKRESKLDVVKSADTQAPPLPVAPVDLPTPNELAPTPEPPTPQKTSGPSPTAAPTATSTPSGAQSNSFVNINSIPAAKVVLDGRPLGSTPKIGVSVTPGTHTVLFVHPVKGRATKTFTVAPGKTVTVSLRFP